MIYCVWYPSGGFGHFINALLTLYGHNFARPRNSLTFSESGDSHVLDLVAPKYSHNVWSTYFEFSADKNYSVLIDNGITDESETFRNFFPNSKIIKICYSDYSWPIVAKTMIVKAMKQDFDQEMQLTKWDTQEPWARREKYFLYLRDHMLRKGWKAKDNDDQPLWVDCMIEYQTLQRQINSIVAIDDFQPVWIKWRKANAAYIDPVVTAQKVLDLVNTKTQCKLDHITDTWSQAVLYYFVWLHHGIEVPHNDFANFFSHTGEILDLIS